MKEKLIEILKGDSGQDGDPAVDDALNLLAALRCDKCQNFSVNRLRGTGLCMENQDLITREVEPDFFCRLWESKA